MTNITSNNCPDNRIKQTKGSTAAATGLPNAICKVGIIGGGVAGSTIALRLAALGVQTYLFESKSSLIDGPPMCHLHAGGNLYREIPDADCIELLKQSIDMLRLYPHSIDVRPTVIAIPQRDDGNPSDLLPRLQLLTKVYRDMVTADSANKVLGEPDDYYRLYDRAQLETLMQTEPELAGEIPRHIDAWVAAAAGQLDLDKLKYPIVAVNEYGWNIFRLAASAQSALSFYPNAELLLNTKVIDVVESTKTKEPQQWQINYETQTPVGTMQDAHSRATGAQHANTASITVDYLINACGFRTGVIDNMLGVPVQRMVEFKASYVTYWDNNAATMPTKAPSVRNEQHIENLIHTPVRLPEIIIHGKRGTPQGMVQLTPYPDGYYQIHSMNKAVTLFNDGLVANTTEDAQPELKTKYLDFIDKGWNPDTLQQRSQRAINQVSEFVPRFANARPTNNALYGGQQIPGDNDTLRVADVSLYPDMRYARAENVKASSALLAADDIVSELVSQELIHESSEQNQIRHQHQWRYLDNISKQDIDVIARELAKQRAFPLPMSGVVTPFKPATNS